MIIRYMQFDNPTEHGRLHIICTYTRSNDDEYNIIISTHVNHSIIKLLYIPNAYVMDNQIYTSRGWDKFQICFEGRGYHPDGELTPEFILGILIKKNTDTYGLYEFYRNFYHTSTIT